MQTFDNTSNPDDQLFIIGDSNPSGAKLGGIVPQSAGVDFIGSTAMLSGDGLPVTVPRIVQFLTLSLQSATGSTVVNLSPNVSPILPAPAPAPDADGDGVLDAMDNCTLVANPSQVDSDWDGYGNACDGDLSNNGFTDAQDTTLFRQQLGQPSVGPTFNAADFNANGSVNAQDTTLYRMLLGSPPGPSGWDCAGTYLCPPFLFSAVIGESTGIIPRQDACGSPSGRTCESLVGNVVTDAMRATYLVDFAIVSSGGLRADLTCPTSDDPSGLCPAYTPPPCPITRGCLDCCRSATSCNSDRYRSRAEDHAGERRLVTARRKYEIAAGVRALR